MHLSALVTHSFSRIWGLVWFGMMGSTAPVNPNSVACSTNSVSKFNGLIRRDLVQRRRPTETGGEKDLVRRVVKKASTLLAHPGPRIQVMNRSSFPTSRLQVHERKGHSRRR
ncbi:hypothetical protein GALMADRAFT_1132534 [Galerina marginata CBS 339.88]|uniref:Secreted protein n=1 Tax=Galerina marginata (strain CBS 339.88) TaxID=685588 RepID=A0A067SH16_GALM3|nr:hypothetical protein GALMADRAFT_1132534 [Galerina marginata CBS 339.88]